MLCGLRLLWFALNCCWHLVSVSMKHVTVSEYNSAIGHALPDGRASLMHCCVDVYQAMLALLS